MSTILQARDVVAMWPSRDDLAADCDVEPIAVYRWERRNRIPPHRYRLLLDAAKRRGIPLSPETLFQMETGR